MLAILDVQDHHVKSTPTLIPSQRRDHSFRNYSGSI